MMTRFDRNLRLGYGFSIAILLVVSLVSYITLLGLLHSNRAVVHSDQVIEKLEKVLSVMKDAETGQRGFLLTGHASYLEPYNGAYREALKLTDTLINVTADDDRQHANVYGIRRLLGQRFDILQRLVEKKQRGEQIATADLDTGKAAMDELRRTIARAEADEHLVLNEGNASLGRYTVLVPGFIILAALVGVGIGLYSYRNITADFREKERLRADIETREQETGALNEELTAANEEITAANEELTSINEELVKAREELATTNESLERRVEERTKALQESDEETQALNEELSATNEELVATNEELAENDRRLRHLCEGADLRAVGDEALGLGPGGEAGAAAVRAHDPHGHRPLQHRVARREQVVEQLVVLVAGPQHDHLLPADLGGQLEQPADLGDALQAVDGSDGLGHVDGGPGDGVDTVAQPVGQLPPLVHGPLDGGDQQRGGDLGVHRQVAAGEAVGPQQVQLDQPGDGGEHLAGGQPEVGGGALRRGDLAQPRGVAVDLGLTVVAQTVHSGQ